MSKNESLSYRQSGVDIDEGDRLVKAIRPLAKQTERDGCLDAIGGFGALFKVPIERYRQPILVSGTDGVGTKVMLARHLNQHDSIGVDLVAMCVNDIIVQGAEPLFFLDYYATGRLETAVATRVIAGIAKGCQEAGAALIGGETAEMPGVYQGEDYDLAGFCVGIVEQSKIIDGRASVQPGHRIIGLDATGPHSNGFSLIRKIVDRYALEVDGDPYATRPFDSSTTLGDALLAPTRIYVKPILNVIESTPVAAIAHITGGGLLDNVARVLPDGCRARIDSSKWHRPALFRWLQEVGNVDEQEMYRTFNCGIGMVIIAAPDRVQDIVEQLRADDQPAREIGYVDPADGKASVSIE